MNTQPSHLKKRLLIPLSISIFLLLFFSVLFFVNLQKDFLEQEMTTLQKTGQQHLKNMIEEESEDLEAHLIHISANEDLQKAWLSKSREELLSISTPIYSKINKTFDITHFYFIDVHDTCYLRVHSPLKYGDRIDRVTFQKTKQILQPTYGLELGVLGTFTLRYVYPWIIDGQLKGYIELGKEIEHLTPRFKEVLDADVTFLIKKELVDKDGWEKGMKLFNKSSDWDTYKDYVITSSTLSHANDIDPFLAHRINQFSLSVDSGNYRCSLNKLLDAGDQDVGYLLISNNVTKQVTTTRTMTMWFIIIGIVIFVVLFLIFWYYISTIEKFIRISFNKIKHQSKEIESSLEEKKVMLKEIHHRVKNNLQVITSLLGLQSSFIDDDNVKALFQYSQYRINSMAMVHEMLYQSDDLTRINYKEYIKQLVDSLISTVKGSDHKINVEINVPELVLNIDTAIPLGLLINEIITNSLKYGLPDDGGKIRLEIRKLEYPKFVMEISDDGGGYSDEINFRNTNSLGLKLMNSLSLQLKGSIEKDNTKKGVHYIIPFQEVD